MVLEVAPAALGCLRSAAAAGCPAVSDNPNAVGDLEQRLVQLSNCLLSAGECKQPIAVFAFFGVL
jgi:hypothetical protein